MNEMDEGKGMPAGGQVRCPCIPAGQSPAPARGTPLTRIRYPYVELVYAMGAAAPDLFYFYYVILS